ncbi:deah-box rna dna, partial [Cystoisospora suis]
VRVFIHPSSINFKLRHFETQWVAFLEKVQTTKTFLKEVSTVPVFALLLLSCCDIEVQASCGLICLDGWIHLRCPGLIGTYVRSLKVLFDALLDDFYTQILANTEAPPGRRTKSLDSSQGQQAYSSTTPTTCSSSSSLSVDLFSGAEGERLRNDISQLVKRLVEYEGHRL